MQQFSTKYTLVFLAIVCLFFSILVSGAAVSLRPRQERNALLDKQRNVLMVADLMEAGETLSADEIQQRFDERIRMRLVNLDTGDYVEDEEAKLANYAPKDVPTEPAPPNPAQVTEVPEYREIYEVYDGDARQCIVLPIQGKGLWGTIYGMLAVQNDGDTIQGITFYQHQETPGLGGEIDNPRWKALWEGRDAYDDDGEPHIQVVKGAAQKTNQVDGLSGATLTSRGVTNLVQFWLDDNGYGPFMANVRKQ